MDVSRYADRYISGRLGAYLVKKNLIIVNSLFNLILAIQLKKTLLNDETDIVISDMTCELKRIYDTGILKEAFDEVYFANYTNLRSHAFTKRYISFFSPKYAIKLLLSGKVLKEYTDIYFWNPDELIYHYLRYLNVNRKNYSLHLYADALGGLTTNVPIETKRYSSNVLNFLDKFIFKYDTISKMKYDYYLFSPQYYIGERDRELVHIPEINYNDINIVKYLNKVFGYENKNIRQKFIFLDGAKDGFIDEDENKKIIFTMIETVGSENFAIKPHPRTDLNYYRDMEIDIISSSIPWELYCLNTNIENKVIITYCSAAAVMPAILYGKKMKVVTYMDLLSSSSSAMEGIRKLFHKVNQQSHNVVFAETVELLEDALLEK